MGTTWSEDGKNSSQQAQPVAHSESSDASTATLKSGNIVPHSTNNIVDNNNNSAYINKPIEASTSPVILKNVHDKPKEANKATNIINNNNIPNYSKPKEAIKVPISNNSNNNTNIKAKEANKVLLKLPHNWEAIIRDCVGHIDKSSIETLYEQLYAGVYLNGRKKKYWVEKKGNNNCFAVFANSLSITWGDNPHYWNLHNEDTSDDVNITVAQLRNVCWLEVHGRLHTANLTPGVAYQVAYLIKLEHSAYGWEVPVNLRLTLPNGTQQERKENLSESPKGSWVRIPVGEFKACQDNLGEIVFSLYEYDGGSWKKGLVIQGAIIEPKIIV